VVALDDSIPMPRAGIAALTVPMLVVSERLGLLEGATAQIEAAIAQLARRRDELAVDPTPVTGLARRIGRTLPIVYGGGSLGEVAAWRWKGQFNENPKVAAFANRLPELTHNEVCGWGQHGDVTRQVFTLVQLRHDHEIGQARQADMADLGLGGPEIVMHPRAGDRGERLARDEAEPARGRHRLHLGAVTPQQAGEFERLVGGDAAGDDEQDSAAMKHGPSIGMAGRTGTLDLGRRLRETTPDAPE
jgi:hypothetical protein